MVVETPVNLGGGILASVGVPFFLTDLVGCLSILYYLTTTELVIQNPSEQGVVTYWFRSTQGLPTYLQSVGSLLSRKIYTSIRIGP